MYWLAMPLGAGVLCWVLACCTIGKKTKFYKSINKVLFAGTVPAKNSILKLKQKWPTSNSSLLYLPVPVTITFICYFLWIEHNISPQWQSCANFSFKIPIFVSFSFLLFLVASESFDKQSSERYYQGSNKKILG